MSVAIALFTRDLRVHDNPVLAAACAGAERIVPLFVRDGAAASPAFTSGNRLAFLAETLADLDAALRRRGGRLVVRDGDTVEQVCRVAREVSATQVHVAGDVSAFAARRTRRLRDALASGRTALHVHDGAHTVVPPGAVTPSGRDHFAVFTPYWRRWRDAPRRAIAPAPESIRLPPIRAARVPGVAQRDTFLPGGESRARQRAADWFGDGLARYAEAHDAPAADATSRLSPYLHFGCLSALELVARAESAGPTAEAFVRQLCWRDFHHQVLAARPDAAHRDYRPRGDRWRSDDDALAAWRAGMTGYPLVDAGMRQLAAQGWMHNRARLVTASFLTKTLYLDWRAGAAHFFAHLLDGDLANNALNWQWIAGTGTDTRPNRVLNPTRQARQHDPDGGYLRRWIPELADLTAAQLFEPWLHPGAGAHGYPAPIVEPGTGLRPGRARAGTV